MSNRLYEPYSTELAATLEVPVQAVDRAIESALVTAAAQDDWPSIPDLDDRVWNRIYSEVEEASELIAQEIEEAGGLL